MTDDVLLPSGTVTLLFSDMESSTTMVRELGDRWPLVLDRQRALCRAAWADHRGHELGTEGDSFFVAFASAEDGVAAALAAQRALAGEDWAGGATVRVRMGLHTGSPQRHGDGYVGLDVHKGARVAAAAHGGQVLLSETTARLVHTSLDPEDRLIDLGEHRLKDIPGRVRLLQVVAAGLARSFPPPRSQGAPGSLPTLAVELVGRDDDLAELEALVGAGTRALTLTGPGGTGKTSLATALARRVAEEFFDGVYLVPLAAVTSADQMWAAVAQVLDVPADGHAPPGFFDYVGSRRVLLVLDNLEQVPDADDMVRMLLEDAPHVAVLSTSRRPLHVPGEVDFAVSALPLAAGTDVEAAQASPAVQLFVGHATRVRRGFRLDQTNAPDVVALVAALDGLPLAIELAAARVKLLSPRAILQRIDQTLDLASNDRSRVDRQRTLRGAIAWSYDLLEPASRQVLDHLGIFVGGASLEALEAVVPTEALADATLVDLLFDLVDASLITVSDTEDGEPRFGLLETVRRFALDALRDNGALPCAEHAHAQYFHDLAVGPLRHRFDDDYRGGRELFLREFDNLRAVVERGAAGVRDEASYGGAPVPPQHVIRVVSAMTHLYRRYLDGLQWVDAGLALPSADPVGSAALLGGRARLLRGLGRTAEALDVVATARRVLAETPGIEQQPASELVSVARTRANLAYDAGQAHSLLGDHEAARAEADVALAAAGSDEGLVVSALDLAMLVSYFAGDIDRARALCLELADHPLSPLRAAMVPNDLADFDLQQDRPEEARRRLATGVERILDAGDPESLITWSLTFGHAVAEVDPLLCARVHAAVAHARVVEGLPDDLHGEEETRLVLAKAAARADADDLAAAYVRGGGENLADLLREAAALPI